MSLAMAIFILITAWLAVAGAMLWGILRIARRHHHTHESARHAADEPGDRPASVH